MSPPSDQQSAFDSLLASLQADLLAWEQAPTVPEGFDPARPWVLTPGGGLTVRTSILSTSVVHLEPGNLVEYSLIPPWGQHLERALGRPWKLVPVTQIRELRIEELTGAILHLKNLRNPEDTEDPGVFTLGDLCRLFGSTDFASLNHRIYKTTSCGASISIYGEIPTQQADAALVERHKKAATERFFREEYNKILPALKSVFQHMGSTEQEQTLACEDAFLSGDYTDFIQWAQSVVPGAFPASPPDFDRVPVVYHNGHPGPIPDTFKLTGFSIHTIIEGSDATVDSNVFPLGTKKTTVDAFIRDMEAEAERLWLEANVLEVDSLDVCTNEGAD